MTQNNPAATAELSQWGFYLTTTEFSHLHTHTLTNDLLAMFDQHVLDHSSKLFNGFGCLQLNIKKKTSAEKTFKTRDSRNDVP